MIWDVAVGAHVSLGFFLLFFLLSPTESWSPFFLEEQVFAANGGPVQPQRLSVCVCIAFLSGHCFLKFVLIPVSKVKYFSLHSLVLQCRNIPTASRWTLVKKRNQLVDQFSLSKVTFFLF